MDFDDELEILGENNQSDGEQAQEVGDGEENTNEAAESGDEAEEVTEKKEIKVKRIVRNPQPKLDLNVLRGKRGVPALTELFKSKKLKGKHHEEQDLKMILKTYEYWCHRMFPKFTFSDCVAKLELLGNKKPVGTYIKKIRLGLEDPIPQPEPILRSSDDEDEIVPRPTVETAESKFDRLLEKPAEPQLTAEQLDIIRINKEKALKLRQERLRMIQRQAEERLGAASSQKESEVKIVEVPLTEDQLERIRLNREKAVRLKEERLKLIEEATSRVVKPTLKQTDVIDFGECGSNKKTINEEESNRKETNLNTVLSEEDVLQNNAIHANVCPEELIQDNLTNTKEPIQSVEKDDLISPLGNLSEEANENIETLNERPTLDEPMDA